MLPTVPGPPATGVRRWGGADFPSLRTHESNPAGLTIHPDLAGFSVFRNDAVRSFLSLAGSASGSDGLQQQSTVHVPSESALSTLKYLSCGPDSSGGTKDELI